MRTREYRNVFIVGDYSYKIKNMFKLKLNKHEAVYVGMTIHESLDIISNDMEIFPLFSPLKICHYNY